MGNKNIRTVMAVIIGVVILVIQSILIYSVANSIYTSNVTATKRDMELMDNTLSKSIADFGSQLIDRLQGVSKIPALREYLLTGQNEEITNQIIVAMSKASPDVNACYIFNAKGEQKILVAQGVPAKLSDLSERDYVKAAMAGKGGYSSVPSYSTSTGKLIVSVTTPIFDDSGKVLGGVGMSYGVDKLLANYIETTRIGETGHPFILSPKGVVVAHPEKDLLLKDISGEPGIAAMLSSPKGEGTMARNGREKMVTWMSVPGWQWVLAFSMDKDEVETSARSERNFMIMLGAGAILVLIGVCLIALEKVVIKPLKQLEEYASGVAEGDLDKSLALRLGNEIGKLADSLRSMVGALKSKIAEADEKSRMANEESAKAAQATQEAEEARHAAERAKAEGMLQAAQQLEEVVEVITSASEELSAQIEQSSHSAEEEARQAAETATAMEEMNATVLEVAKNASQAADTADMAKHKAQNGSQVVTLVVKGIGEVQSQALEMKSDMTTLGKQAEGIGQILNVISDIADQTNLLALNAAIEAARAGEAGRGFAVVADEVRKLAEKTMTATKEVGEAIHGIQAGTKRNIENGEKSVQKIDAATDRANESGKALDEIVSLVDLTTDQVRSIATASEQQSAASEEINRRIEDINRISSETSNAMRQSAQAVGELAHQAQVLKSLIDHMKAEGGGSTNSRVLSAGTKALS